MSVCIKGMEMPMGCCGCDLIRFDSTASWECMLDPNEICEEFIGEMPDCRPNECPLEKVGQKEGSLDDIEKRIRKCDFTSANQKEIREILLWLLDEIKKLKSQNNDT